MPSLAIQIRRRYHAVSILGRFALFLGLILLFAPSASRASTLTTPSNNLGLVGYWKLDDATGTQATDFSGRGNSGTLTNGPTWTAGKFGKAMSFRGSTDYLNIDGSFAAVAAYSESSTYTISMWIKGAPNQAYKSLYSEGSSSTDVPYLTIRTQNGTGKIQVIINNDANLLRLNQATTNAVVFDNTWHHFVWVNDSANSKAYVDGAQDAGIFSTFSSSGGTYTLNQRTIGNFRRTTVGDSFVGSIDDFRIYNRALSASEIARLYSAGAPTVKARNNKGLVGYWSFEDGTGTQATDFSGKRNTGTLTNGPVWVGGKFGKALSFNGSAQYVEATTTMNLDAAGTASLWFKGNTLDTTQRFLISKGSKGGSANLKNGFGISARSNACITVAIGDASTDQTIASLGCPLSDNVWYHVALTWNGTTVATYLNGAQVDSRAQTVTPTTTIYPLRIAETNDESRAFKGQIDDVRIYNRALSAAEVLALYESGATTASPTIRSVSRNGLVGYWKLDDATGTQATDFSGKGNTGALTGGPAWINGKLGKALYFDGSNDAVEAGYAGPPISTTSNFTISFWAKPLNIDDDRYIVNGLQASGNNNPSVILGYQNGYWNIYNQSYAGGSAANSQVPATVGVWQHVTYASDGASLRGYLNGALSITYNGSFLPIANFVGVTLGTTSPIGGGTYYNGFLDDVRIYNRALSATEIQTLYDSGR